MGWGDPIGFSICSFAQWDLEVGVHGIMDIPVWSSFVSFGVSLNGRLKPFDLVFEGEHGEAMDFVTILDGLDQTSRNFSESGGVNVDIGGEYVFHSMRSSRMGVSWDDSQGIQRMH